MSASHAAAAHARLLRALSSWVIYFDTIYATQDRKDDVKAGVKSTAVLFGNNIRLVNGAFAAVFVACLALGGIFNQQGPLYFLVSCVGAAAHFCWQLLSWNVESAKNSADLFKVCPYLYRDESPF